MTGQPTPERDRPKPPVVVRIQAFFRALRAWKRAEDDR